MGTGGELLDGIMTCTGMFEADFSSQLTSANCTGPQT